VKRLTLKQIIPSEHFAFWDFVRLFLINVVADCYKALTERVLLRNFKAIIQFRYMQFMGTYRGFTHRDPVSQNLKRIFYYPNSQLHPKESFSKTGTTDRIDYSAIEVGSKNEKHY